MKHKCISKVAIMGSDSGLVPALCQAIIWTNGAILLIWSLGTNFGDILIEIQHFYSRKSIWKCRLENDVHFVSASMCQDQK